MQPFHNWCILNFTCVFQILRRSNWIGIPVVCGILKTVLRPGHNSRRTNGNWECSARTSRHFYIPAERRRQYKWRSRWRHVHLQRNYHPVKSAVRPQCSSKFRQTHTRRTAGGGEKPPPKSFISRNNFNINSIRVALRDPLTITGRGAGSAVFSTSSRPIPSLIRSPTLFTCIRRNRINRKRRLWALALNAT